MTTVAEQSLLDQVEVIITTRNRIEALKYTLNQCQQLGIRFEQISVTDDASTDYTSSTLKGNYPDIKLYTNAEAKGLIVNRNLMMRNSKKEYVLSLDDDSNLLSINDLIYALKILKYHDSYAVFCFGVIEQKQQPIYKSYIENVVIYKSFIGCGHIIKRRILDQIGYYREEFIFYEEENDFSIRCYQAGFRIVGNPGVNVHHRVNANDRIQQLKGNINSGEYGIWWRSKMSVSNSLLKITMYYPLYFIPFYLMKYLVGQFYFFQFKVKSTKGYWQGLIRYIKLLNFALKQRKSFSLNSFINWNSLPMYETINDKNST